MATDATGTPTSLGIPKFNTAADAPSGLGTNAMMDSIDVLVAARAVKPSGIVAGEVPVWNGSSWDRSSVTKVTLNGIAGPVLLGVRVLTNSGTYAPTAGTRAVYIEAVGGGGQGGGSALTAAGQAAAGGGGGGGAYSSSLLTSGFTSVPYVIGAGGSTSVAGANTGQAGADTTFNATVIVAKGGSGGAGGAALASAGVGAGPGAGGVIGTGDIIAVGAAGTAGLILAAGAGISGQGGPGALGGGIPTPVGGTAGGIVGGNYGAGGGGSFTGAAAAAQKGGNGANGLIRVWEFA